MADRPIIFSAPMVRAILSGVKTQHRVVLKPQPRQTDKGEWYVATRAGFVYLAGIDLDLVSPYAVGDRLWCREAFYLGDDGDYEYAVPAADTEAVSEHVAKLDRLMRTHPEASAAWERLRKLRPSIHMPRWASRLTLTVTDGRVQRLQEISEEDARAEGVDDSWLVKIGLASDQRRRAFQFLWEDLHGPSAWSANPWVCALTFTVERRNIDAKEG